MDVDLSVHLFQALIPIVGQPFEERMTRSSSYYKAKITSEENQEVVQVCAVLLMSMMKTKVKYREVQEILI